MGKDSKPTQLKPTSSSLPLSDARCVLCLPRAVVPLCSCAVLLLPAPMVGCRLVLPGPALDGASMYHMIEAYKVRSAALYKGIGLCALRSGKPKGG
jgi:hypothetical protein